jgi:hypothetical protein
VCVCVCVWRGLFVCLFVCSGGYCPRSICSLRFLIPVLRSFVCILHDRQLLQSCDSMAIPELRRLVAGLSPRWPWFGPSSCAICGGRSGTGIGFSPSLSVFPCRFHYTYILYSLTWGMDKGPLEAQFDKDIVSLPGNNNKVC